VSAPFARPASGTALGADALGRDVLSRVLDGGHVLLTMALIASGLGVITGAVLGVMAAYSHGARDSLIMRTLDVILAFPSLVLALLLVSVVGPRLWLVVVAVALSHAPQVARVIRAASLDLAVRDYVKVVELQGTSRSRIILREILPNLMTPLMVELGLRLTYSIVFVAGLSFLGFGRQPPASDWGLMIQENRLGIVANPWGVLAPAVVLALLTIGTNTLADAVARTALGVDARRRATPADARSAR
jgi:peptide/nickel transport system permease protein